MTGQRHILVVDDDSDLRAALRRPLIADGYTVTESGSAADAARVATIPGRRFDVIILDLGLPDGDGRDLCVELRRQGISVPIILLTGLSEENEVVRGLDSGANDYIIKPFRVSELLARVRAQVRAHDISEDAELTIGRFRFRPGDQLLIQFDGLRVRLTGKEAAVLKYLFRACTAVTRAELLQQVLGLLVASHRPYGGDAYLSLAPEAGGRPGPPDYAAERGRRLPALPERHPRR